MGARGLTQAQRFKGALISCFLYTIACILAVAGIAAAVEPVQAINISNMPPGGGPNQTRFITRVSQKSLSESNPLADIDSPTDIRIDVNSDPPGITDLTGGGSYAVGELLRLSAPATVDDNIKPGVQYRFVRWKLPNGETMGMANLSVMVSESGTFTANYDTYYLLSLKSYYPKVDQKSWHAAGSTAEYSLDQEKVPMPGILGFLGGFKKAVNPQGTHLMEGPYTVNITWTDDYTTPLIIITGVILLVILLVLFRRRRARGQVAPASVVKELPQPQVQDTAITEVHTAEEISLAPPSVPAAKTEPAAKPNFCPNCGDPVTEVENFCTKCGRQLI